MDKVGDSQDYEQSSVIFTSSNKTLLGKRFNYAIPKLPTKEVVNTTDNSMYIRNIRQFPKHSISLHQTERLNKSYKKISQITRKCYFQVTLAI